MPRSVEASEGALRIEGPFELLESGCSGVFVANAFARFERDVSILVGVPLTGIATPIVIRCAAAKDEVAALDASESYRLRVSAGGVAIDSEGEIGVLRALATLRQLIRLEGESVALPQVAINDAPRFPWRGLLIDTARHFVSIDTLERQIDAMELTKLNVLHLHLSDDEGFRVQSERYPKLTEVGAHGEFYSQAEIRELVRYATARGVRVVPEFDMPGHSLAMLSAHPELAAETLGAGEGGTGAALNPASEVTYGFLAGILGEMTGLFTDPYFHVGGDEATSLVWQESPRIAAFKARHDLETDADLEAYFHDRVRRILRSKGRTPIGWEEIAAASAPEEVVVQVWRSSNSTSQVTAAGHRAIVSAGYDLSQLHSVETVYGIDPLDPSAHESVSVGSYELSAGTEATERVAEPMPPLTAAQRERVLGGEAVVWGHIIDEEMLEQRTWPIAAAVAERLWSPAALQDATDLKRRLVSLQHQLRALGLRDDMHTRRMIARLAPDEPEPVATLLSAVAPVRNYAHRKRLLETGAQPLIDLADAASPDSLEALRFGVEVERYLAGERVRAGVLRTQLARWRDNHAAFEVVAAGRPKLEAALPTSRHLAELGGFGIAALDALEVGKPLSAAVASPARALLDLLDREEAASRDLTALRHEQPPGDVFIRVAPEVRRLVEAAAGASG
ncbi:MAG: family 20 glycosylhydrolase [Deltaproteobacteria bacterium]|nr:family 20 glycosylhydrolase [Deltaproteobacteria bacterium]